MTFFHSDHISAYLYVLLSHVYAGFTTRKRDTECFSVSIQSELVHRLPIHSICIYCQVTIPKFSYQKHDTTGIHCNRVKVHSFPYKMTLKSSYLVKPFTFCDTLTTPGCLKLTSEKCPFLVHF
jgi:hypothetical protein